MNAKRMTPHEVQQMFLAAMQLRNAQAARRRTVSRLDQIQTAAANAIGAVRVLENIPAEQAQRIAEDVSLDLARISIGSQP